MAQYILNVRDEAPLEERRSALADFAAHYGTQSLNTEGRIILWSSTGWNCGYAEPVQEETHD